MASIFHFLLCLSLISISYSITEASSRPRALVLPVTKDSSTSQYVAQIKQRTPLVPIKLAVHLGGEDIWVDCEHGYVSSSYRPARCRSAQCSLANSKSCIECYSSPKPGCNNNTCGGMPYNPFIRTSTSGELGEDVFSLQSTDGSNPGRPVTAPRVILTCGATFLLEGLASGVKGIAGLGRTQVTLPSQFSRAFSFARKFAICLSPGTGVVFFGDGPYVFLPRPIDFSKSLTYTPLFINPVPTGGAYFEGEKSSEYFIGVKSIKIRGVPVPLNKTLLTIDQNGVGGTKISTVDSFTVLESSIYEAFTKTFIKQVGNIPRVAPVAPFTTCYKSSSFLSTRVGPNVPQIDLVLQNEKVIWPIFGSNSMTYVNNDVLCLAFVDGGVNPTTSIVIGGHQIENNLLQFDAARSRLGFSSTLLFRQTTCANFNFTSIA